jgi:Tol biopolymer transport system component
MKHIITLVFLITSNFVYSQTSKTAIDYFGQIDPDTIPKIFAPGIISLEDRFEARGAFSPDGKTFYFTVTNTDFTSQKILFCENVNKKWTKPDTSDFSKVFNNHEPFISFDGQKLFFTSDRDRQTKENTRDLYVVNKSKSGWSAPVKLDTIFNSGYTEYFFCQSKNGTIYFASNRPGGNGMLDIYFSKPEKGEYKKATNMGGVINKGYTGDPCVAPDESYMIFPSARTEGADNTDLFISFNKNGSWTTPVNMGNPVNTKANEYGAFFSPDGKYLFFIRHDGKKSDIYWVRSSIINQFRGK